MTTDLNPFSAYVGVEAEPARVSRYTVNEAMILNWCEAHEDYNPIYLDQIAAKASGRNGTVCPPAMVSTWVMSGLKRYREVQKMRTDGRAEDFAYSRLMSALDAAGYTSVVATDVEQTFTRELHPGDHVTAYYTIESISDTKETGLGEGRFITLLKHYCDQNDELVCEERFRLLRFKPKARETGVDA